MIDKIKRNHLCLGCGLCASVLGHEKYKMELTDEGFYEPIKIQETEETEVKQICPAIRVHGNNSGKLWGRYINVFEGWACDDDVRYHASSGGVVTALAIYLLEEKNVDAVLHVGVANNSYLYNELKISRSKEDVINNAQSRYAPALTLYNIKQILDKSDEVFAFIGKGCDIAGVKNLIMAYPQYKDRFKLLISIICAGMPSYKGTKKAWGGAGKIEEPKKISYRGDGWPGYFKAIWEDKSEFKLTYNDSWGKILSGYLNFRCKVCADGIGSLADISVGDSWRTKDGYPDFEEQDGRCLVFVRTTKGDDVLQKARDKGYVIYSDINVKDIKYMQPGQYSRRKYAGWRILPVQVITRGLLNFRGLGYIRLSATANYFKGIVNMKGTIIRMIRLLRS